MLKGTFSISIAFEVPLKGVCWISGVYGPPSPRGRSAFWEELGRLFGLCGDKWCLAGDFNVVRFPLEKSSGGRILNSMRAFNSIIEDCSLVDPPLVNGRFTWTGRRVSCRLDRFLLSKEWIESFSRVRQFVGPIITYDHWPVCLDADSVKCGALVPLGLKICGFHIIRLKRPCICGGMSKFLEGGKVSTSWVS